MVVVVYDDAAYGAEVHHFGPDGHARWTPSRFPETDLAAIGARLRLRGGHGARAVADLDGRRGLAGRARARAPLLVDAKVAAGRAVVVARGGVPRPLNPGPPDVTNRHLHP